MDRIILIGVDQGVMIGGRFDGWLAHLTHAGWVTVRKFNEADPYAVLPEVLRQSQCTELGAVGPATGVSLGQSAHDAEKRRRDFLSSFPVVDAASSPELSSGRSLADATSNPPLPDLSSLRKGAEVADGMLNRIIDGLRERSAAEQPVAGFNDFQMKLAAEYVLDAIADVIEAALVSGSREEQS